MEWGDAGFFMCEEGIGWLLMGMSCERGGLEL